MSEKTPNESELVYGFIKTLEKEIELGIDTKGYFVTITFDDVDIPPLTFSFEPHDASIFEKIRHYPGDPERDCAFYSHAEWVALALFENPRVISMEKSVEAILNRLSLGEPDKMEYYHLNELLVATNHSICFIISNDVGEPAIAN